MPSYQESGYHIYGPSHIIIPRSSFAGPERWACPFLDVFPHGLAQHAGSNVAWPTTLLGLSVASWHSMLGPPTFGPQETYPNVDLCPLVEC